VVAVSNSTCESVIGELCVYSMQPNGQLLCLTPDGTERPTARPPSRRGHITGFGVKVTVAVHNYDLTLSVI